MHVIEAIVCQVAYLLRRNIARWQYQGILESLPPGKFLQVHKSHIVNLDFITTIEGNMLHVGQAKITVGQSYLSEVMSVVLKDRFIKR